MTNEHTSEPVKTTRPAAVCEDPYVEYVARRHAALCDSLSFLRTFDEMPAHAALDSPEAVASAMWLLPQRVRLNGPRLDDAD